MSQELARSSGDAKVLATTLQVRAVMMDQIDMKWQEMAGRVTLNVL